MFGSGQSGPIARAGPAIGLRWASLTRERSSVVSGLRRLSHRCVAVGSREKRTTYADCEHFSTLPKADIDINPDWITRSPFPLFDGYGSAIMSAIRPADMERPRRKLVARPVK
jgi:hypothetical protein